MTIASLLKTSEKKLRRSLCHSNSARLDAEVLLSHVLGRDRTRIAAYPELELTDTQTRKFYALIRRRARHEPVAYLIGHKEFYGLDFRVDRRVLIPRPETELLVELALCRAGIHSLRGGLNINPHAAKNFIDVGTGSGAIAIALAKTIPNARVMATDASATALRVARANAKIHDIADRIKFVRANLLPPHVHAFAH